MAAARWSCRERCFGIVEFAPPLGGLPDGFGATQLAGEARSEINANHREDYLDQDGRRYSHALEHRIRLSFDSPDVPESFPQRRQDIYGSTVLVQSPDQIFDTIEFLLTAVLVERELQQGDIGEASRIVVGREAPRLDPL